ncbi:MAG: DNA internalization-related competence protein ComEC/Rec2 [Burkholderiaceae bacterium]|nr:DNA internalization-related competence protein ComEC/Rec2 [Burkholderiaceae bacterium]
MTFPIPDARCARRQGVALAAALAGYLAGTALQLQQPALWGVGVYAALAGWSVAAVALAWWLRRRAAATALWLLAGALLAFAAAGWRAAGMQAQVLNPALEGRDVQVTGVISAMPQHSEAGWRMRFDVEQAQQDGQPVVLPPSLQLGWYSSADETNEARPVAAPLRAGDRWRLTVRLKAPHGNRNPHGFDYELLLWEQGVQATGYVRTGRADEPPRLLAEAVGWPLERLRQQVRDRILSGVPADGDAGAQRMARIVAALVTGDQNAIVHADWDVFRITGVAHLMSISGLHITMFAWLASALVGALWRRAGGWAGEGRFNVCLWLPAPHAALIGGVLLAAGYALFSGWGVPAQRTILMLGTVAALKLAGLRWPWWMTWLLACAVVLAADPWAMMQAGFWLSFVAVGVLFATDPGSGDTRQKSLWGRFRQLLHEQGVVTLALTPLTLLLFGQASVVGLLANLVAIPWVTLVVTPLAFGGVLWSTLWRVAAWAMAPLSALLQALAALPFASVSVPAAPLALSLAAVVGGFLLALSWPWKLRLTGLPMVAALLLWQPARPLPGAFDLLAVDVGQGSAVLLRTAGHTLLYDAGPRYSLESDAGDRVLVPLLHALGERVDVLLLSHRDNDHSGGAVSVLAAQPEAALRSSFDLAGHPFTRCEAGQSWQWDGVTFELLHPAADYYASARSTNAVSCVLHVRAGDGASVLLTGDIEAAQEAMLARTSPADLRADVLLAPHHGSRSSSSAALLDAVRPRLTLIQSGYRNRYGHPAPEVVARYVQRGIPLTASPACGAMHWRSDDPGEVRCERDLARHYWQHQAARVGR